MLQELRALPHSGISGMTVTSRGTWCGLCCGRAGGPDCTTLVVEPRTQSQSTEEFSNIPMILLHELVCAVSRPNLFGVSGMDLYTLELFKKASRDLGLDAGKTIGLSFWLDGVAVKWDRSDSFDTLTMSIPGLVGPWRNLRVPLCVIDHSRVIKCTTWDDVLPVVPWSLDHWALNAHPVQLTGGEAT